MYGLPVGTVFKAKLEHRLMIKIAKGQVDEQTAIDEITSDALDSVYMIEDMLFGVKDSFDKYLREFDETQAKIDRDKDDNSGVCDILRNLYATNFRDLVSYHLHVYYNEFADYFSTYVREHYLRVTYGPHINMNVYYKDLCKKIESNPHYESLWKKVIKAHSNKAYGGNDPRIFMPNPKCVSRYISFARILLFFENLGKPIFNEYGEVMCPDGRVSFLSGHIFTEQWKEAGLPGSEYRVNNLPHYNFYGKIEEAPITPIDEYSFASEDNPDIVWEKELVLPEEIVLKNGTIMPSDLAKEIVNLEERTLFVGGTGKEET